ncbi:MAG: amidohydrolase family protein [Planctomycetia bacterium]|nr:amidohydrolase family protein [Planctomycetia bacterium]
MIVDLHVHVFADTPNHGWLSDELHGRSSMRFIRWRLGLPSVRGAVFEQAVAAKLQATVAATPQLHAAVVLAFDAVYDQAGNRDEANTHLHVTNDYVARLTEGRADLLFGASIHPYRPDAVAELERCVQRGAVLLKWLPIVQNFNPSDPRCLPFYEALAHHRLPLLCHTGGEQSLIALDPSVADPLLLEPALKAGVTVIAAHCGTRSQPVETDYVPAFVRLAHEYEHCYGDTSALNLPARSYAYDTILEDPVVRDKLVHGSDWPVMPVPTRRIGWLQAAKLLLHESNWMRRDIAIKQRLGFDEAYWQRGATLLRRRDVSSPAPA